MDLLDSSSVDSHHPSIKVEEDCHEHSDASEVASKESKNISILSLPINVNDTIEDETFHIDERARIKDEIKEELEEQAKLSTVPANSCVSDKNQFPRMDAIQAVKLLRITTTQRKPIKILRLKPFEDFVSEGAALLGFIAHAQSFQLVTEDGCDIDNDDGLIYCVQNKLMVIFQPLQTVTSSSEPRPCLPVMPAIATWPRKYSLPTMDEWIEVKILNCKTSEEAEKLKNSSMFCTALLKPIMADIEKYAGTEGYLKAWQFRLIGNALLRKYPILKDQDGSWESLKQKLVRKLRYVRSKITNDNVEEMRKRYTTKSNKRRTQKESAAEEEADVSAPKKVRL